MTIYRPNLSKSQTESLSFFLKKKDTSVAEGHKYGSFYRTSWTWNVMHNTWLTQILGSNTFLDILFSCFVAEAVQLQFWTTWNITAFRTLLFIWDHGFGFKLHFLRDFLQKNVELLSQLHIRFCRWDYSHNLSSKYFTHCEFISDYKKASHELNLRAFWWCLNGYAKCYTINEPCMRKKHVS